MTKMTCSTSHSASQTLPASGARCGAAVQAAQRIRASRPRVAEGRGSQRVIAHHLRMSGR